MNVIDLRLDGHLSRAFLDERLSAATAALDAEAGRCGLLVDCRDMPGYDRDAREDFVTWNKANRHRLAGVAVVTSNPMYRMVIGAMSLASSQDMKAFATEEEGDRWLRALEPPKVDAA